MTYNKLRALILAVIVTASIVTATGAAVAADEQRATAGNDDPVTVYLGERNHELRNSEDLDDGDYTVGDDLTVVGHSGDADGTTASVDSGSADYVTANGFASGHYYIDDDSGSGDDIDITVRDPTVFDITVFNGSGTDGDDLTANGTIPEDADAITVQPEFNFDPASYVEVVFEAPDGSHVGGAKRITINKGTATFDLSDVDLQDDTYTIEVTAPRDGDDIGLEILGNEQTQLDANKSVALDVCTASENCQALGDAESKGIALGDVDGDGDVDAVLANHGPNAIWLNDGSGSFSRDDQSLGDATSNAVAIADLDGDDDLDLFFANTGKNAVWKNDGSGQFSKSEQSQILNAMGVDAGDVDGDGVYDIVLARSSPNDVRLSEASVNSAGGSDASGLDDHWQSDDGDSDDTKAGGTPAVQSAVSETETADPSTTTATAPTTATADATPTPTDSPTPAREPTAATSPTPTQGHGLGPVVALFAVLIVGWRRH